MAFEEMNEDTSAHRAKQIYRNANDALSAVVQNAPGAKRGPLMDEAKKLGELLAEKREDAASKGYRVFPVTTAQRDAMVSLGSLALAYYYNERRNYVAPPEAGYAALAGSTPLLDLRREAVAKAFARTAKKRNPGKPPKKKARKNPGEPEHAKARLAYRITHWGHGGKGKTRPATFADPEGPVAEIGELLAVEYRTTKIGDPKGSVYRHEFGPKGRPRLAFNTESRRLLVADGKARMLTKGITG